MNALYFIALIPPEDLKDEIQQLKLYVKEKFKSAHSLNAPPHITLLSPFRLTKEHEANVHSLLEELTQELEPLEVKLKDFSTFPPRVIFIDVVLSEALKYLQAKTEALARAHEELFKYNYAPRPYHPHVTLAFKDLTKSNFYRAWKEFENKSFEASFLADHLYLLKHDGKRWLVHRSYPLDSKTG